MKGIDGAGTAIAKDKEKGVEEPPVGGIDSLGIIPRRRPVLVLISGPLLVLMFRFVVC